MLLSVHYNGSEVEIQCDRAGLDRLIDRLEALRRRRAPDHEYLMTEAWGGEGLTEGRPGSVEELINHLKVTLWADQDQSV